ncbi:hypothetical protein [Sphingobacterium sp. 40-24]|uniref:hypothetical protein n=1 Tax=Sphingobacterium sp. 40-24 TaxID=1895843 RepID=UPI00095E7C5B|nr:hypothetical protein [Sphingobacterium sp. 40-24]OJZ07120.1 MAG: hypothetical protein BGP15_18000 [Sphingobacterium sp. 40-24]
MIPTEKLTSILTEQYISENFVIADLIDEQIQSGFAWGKFGPNIDKAKRHQTELIWGIEKSKDFYQSYLDDNDNRQSDNV